ncbi:sigma-70 family RNA polymerase sigma factor [Croceibacterium sp. TMG7-5b_MA50]|uniref:sigma-70 family RNA polymerase sigma factor n=1 Tax=Croceibacterium sp. TMG7-5b_MA50 TaxID=3121290 RepID=UPI0032220FE6
MATESDGFTAPVASSPAPPDQSRRAALQRALIATGLQDTSAFRQVYEMTSAKLFGICLRICGERQAAEDVLQEVYLLVWRRAPGYEAGRASPITWLATIARNRAIDWRRANVRVVAEPEWDAEGTRTPEQADDAPPVDMILIAEEDARQLHECLEVLDDKPRLAIRAAFLGGLTYSDLARREGVPLATMKSTVRRGLLQLRKCLTDVA